MVKRVPPVCARGCGQSALAIPPFAVIGGEPRILVSVSLKLPTLFAWPKTSLGGPSGKDHCSQTLGFPALDLVPQSCPAWSCDRRNPGPLGAQSVWLRGTWPAPHPRDRGFSLLFSSSPANLTSGMFNFGSLIKGKRLVAGRCEISVNETRQKRANHFQLKAVLASGGKSWAPIPRYFRNPPPPGDTLGALLLSA